MTRPVLFNVGIREPGSADHGSRTTDPGTYSAGNLFARRRREHCDVV